MDALNSTSSRQVSPQENMRAIEKAVKVADQRIRMRRTANANAQIGLTMLVAVPLSYYLVYNLFGASGAWHNAFSSSGAYLDQLRHFMERPRTGTQMFRPELHIANQSGALAAYSKKVEARRAEGTLPEGVAQPTSWL